MGCAGTVVGIPRAQREPAWALRSDRVRGRLLGPPPHVRRLQTRRYRALAARSVGQAAAGDGAVAGCGQATGSDVKAFCCAPVHALVLAGALVQSGIYRNVVVVGGASLAKLGMKMMGHLAKDMPLLEDCLAAVAILVGPADGSGVRLRLDAVGRHTVVSGGSAGAIYAALLTQPPDPPGPRIPD